MAEKEYIERVNYCKNICLCSEDKCEKDKCPIWCVSTADVAPVRHGCWINENFSTRCSACGNMAIYDKYGQEVESDYCPRCGTKMDRKEE